MDQPAACSASWAGRGASRYSYETVFSEFTVIDGEMDGAGEVDMLAGEADMLAGEADVPEVVEMLGSVR